MRGLRCEVIPVVCGMSCSEEEMKKRALQQHPVSLTVYSSIHHHVRSVAERSVQLLCGAMDVLPSLLLSLHSVWIQQSDDAPR